MFNLLVGSSREIKETQYNSISELLHQLKSILVGHVSYYEIQNFRNPKMLFGGIDVDPLHIVEREVTRIVHFRIQASNFAELLIGMSCLQNVF